MMKLGSCGTTKLSGTNNSPLKLKTRGDALLPWGAFAGPGVVAPGTEFAFGATAEPAVTPLGICGETGGKSVVMFRALGLTAGVTFAPRADPGETLTGFKFGSHPPPKTLDIERSGNVTLTGGGGGAWYGPDTP